MTKELAPRQVEVLKWLCEGKTSSEGAQLMGISERTFANYKFHIMDRLQVNSTALLVRWAIREGLIDP
jgi:two-component system, NarL family, response regulator DegU